LAGAILLETFALAVWNVGTRAPAAVLRDIVRALRNRRAFVTGTLSLIVGLIFVAAATVLLLPAVYDVGADFVPLEIFTFLAALAIEYLIGADLRTVIARVAGMPRPN
jgi:hypothetical protein